MGTPTAVAKIQAEFLEQAGDIGKAFQSANETIKQLERAAAAAEKKGKTLSREQVEQLRRAEKIADRTKAELSRQDELAAATGRNSAASRAAGKWNKNIRKFLHGQVAQDLLHGDISWQTGLAALKDKAVKKIVAGIASSLGLNGSSIARGMSKVASLAPHIAVVKQIYDSATAVYGKDDRGVWGWAPADSNVDRSVARKIASGEWSRRQQEEYFKIVGRQWTQNPLDPGEGSREAMEAVEAEGKMGKALRRDPDGPLNEMQRTRAYRQAASRVESVRKSNDAKLRGVLQKVLTESTSDHNAGNHDYNEFMREFTASYNASLKAAKDAYGTLNQSDYDRARVNAELAAKDKLVSRGFMTEDQASKLGTKFAEEEKKADIAHVQEVRLSRIQLAAAEREMHTEAFRRSIITQQNQARFNRDHVPMKNWD